MYRACVYFGNGDALLGLRYFAAIGKVAAEVWRADCAAPRSRRWGRRRGGAIDFGFTSVMFDGSLFPYDENVRLTRVFADMAHEAKVCFEAELGEVPKPGINAPLEGEEGLTDPDEAAAFVAATGIDLLAVALGSLHAETENTSRWI